MALSEITNYIEDDWDDNALTNRTGSEQGYYLHPSDTLISDFEAGSTLKGVYRPDWDTRSGTPSVSSGTVNMDGGDNIATPSSFAVGRWEFDMTFSSTLGSGTASYARFGFAYRNADNRLLYDITAYNSSNADIFIRKYEGGSSTNIIEISRSADTSTHTYAVTRTPYGDFEAFVDGTSQGTGTDSFLPENFHLDLELQSNVPSTDIDNLVVQ